MTPVAEKAASPAPTVADAETSPAHHAAAAALSGALHAAEKVPLHVLPAAEAVRRPNHIRRDTSQATTVIRPYIPLVWHTRP